MATKSKKKRRKKMRILPIVVVLLLIILGSGTAYFSHRFDSEPIRVVVEDKDISHLSEKESETLLMEQHAWNMTIKYENQTYKVENYLEPIIRSTVAKAHEDQLALENDKKTLSVFQKALRGIQGKKAETLEYDLSIENSEEIAKSIADQIEKDWSIPAIDSELTGYNETTATFNYSDEQEGIEIDGAKLAKDLKDALDAKDYEATLTATAGKIAPTVFKSDYKLIGTYTTNTTANTDRNTNVRLASEAINGYILESGVQFSFNSIVGQRTPEKGYKEEAAYSADEVVQEYGGGVCQVSSTLYNAVIAAGLQTDVRTGHTFKPTYVTPGQDATVSYTEPDFAFTNTSPYPIGIKATYWDQTVCVEIYGYPVLEEGVTRYLRSEKTKDLDPPEPTYEEDPEIPYGEERIITAEESGSEWSTDIITQKDGQIISEEFLHTTRYKGHPAIIKRNTKVKDKDKDKDSEKKKDKRNKKNDTPTEEDAEPASGEPEEAESEPETNTDEAVDE